MGCEIEIIFKLKIKSEKINSTLDFKPVYCQTRMIWNDYSNFKGNYSNSNSPKATNRITISNSQKATRTDWKTCFALAR